jgi:hypothetical protein
MNFPLNTTTIRLLLTLLVTTPGCLVLSSSVLASSVVPQSSQKLAHLIQAIAEDTTALTALQHNPEVLMQSHSLSLDDISALRSAERFAMKKDDCTGACTFDTGTTITPKKG